MRVQVSSSLRAQAGAGALSDRNVSLLFAEGFVHPSEMRSRALQSLNFVIGEQLQRDSFEFRGGDLTMQVELKDRYAGFTLKDVSTAYGRDVEFEAIDRVFVSVHHEGEQTMKKCLVICPDGTQVMCP